MGSLASEPCAGDPMEQSQQLNLVRNAAGVVQAHLDEASFHLLVFSV